MRRPTTAFRFPRLVLRAVCVGMLAGSLLGAVPQAGEAESDESVRAATVEQLKGLDSDGGVLDPARAETLRALYEATLEALDARAASLEQAARFEAEAAGADEELAKIRAALDAQDDAEAPATEGKSLAELEALKNAAKLEADEAQFAVEALEPLSLEGADRRTRIADDIARVATERADVERRLNADAPAADGDRIAKALQAQLRAERRRLIARAEELRIEDATFAVRRELRVGCQDLCRTLYKKHIRIRIIV